MQRDKAGRKKGAWPTTLADEDSFSSDDIPPWCDDNDKKLDKDNGLLLALASHYYTRQVALDHLASLANGEKVFNLDFISYYSKYFYINENCLCDTIVKNARQLGKEGKVGTAYIVEISKGMKLIMKRINNVMVPKYLSLRILPSVDVFGPFNAINVFHSLQEGSGKNNDMLLHVQGDSFCNQTCMHMILNLLLNGISSNFVYQYDAFYCKTSIGTGGGWITGDVYSGYNIMEWADRNTLSDYFDSLGHVTTRDLSQVMDQLLPTLLSLKSPLFGFQHADLKCKNVFVASGKDGTPVFKLADFDKSSIFFRGIRFHSASPLPETITSRLPVTLFPKQTSDEGVSFYQLSAVSSRYEYLVETISKYTGIKGAAGLVQMETMYNPYGFYSSYDLYTLIFSMMMEPSVWEHFQRMMIGKTPLDHHMQAWISMWFDEDYDDVMGTIASYHQKYQELLSESDNKASQFLNGTMRSISNINELIARGAWKLKIDVSEAYRLFLNGKEKYVDITKQFSIQADDVGRDIIVSADNHICVTSCDKWCNTNRYSKTSYTGSKTIYDWDYCQE